MVSSDVADAKEALGDTLLIYENDDPKQLAAAIDKAITIVKDDGMLQSYEKKIAEVVRENSIAAVADKVNHLLDVCEAQK